MTTKPKILFVAHNSVLSPSFGGVETYINTLTKYLKNEYDVYWYVPYHGDDGVGVRLIGPDKQSIKTILFKTSFENWQLGCPEREKSFTKVLQELDIELVHFHHLAGQPPSLVRVAKEASAKTVFTFHDYYSICHISNLVNFEGEYCHPDSIPVSSCDTCLNKKYAILPGSQQIRRSYWNALFTYLDGLIFNTQGSFDLVSKIYPEVASHINVMVLPVAIEEVIRPALPPKTGDELRVAILGNLNHHKGADVIIEAIEQLAEKNVSFHFFGDMDPIYDEKLTLSKNSQIFRYGKYPQGKLPKELFLCDISLHVSICPETYGLTLSEAWGVGLVPIASNIGAFSERIVNGENGILVNVGSSPEVVNALREIENNQSDYLPLKQFIKDSLSNEFQSHANAISGFYREIILSKAVPTTQTDNQLASALKDILIVDKWASFPSNKISSQSQMSARYAAIKKKIYQLIRR
jgi:glycosyltransferase involved in cell wall biosynthesis